MKKPQKADKKPKHIKNIPEEHNKRTDSQWQFIANQLKTTNISCIEEFYLNMDIPKRTFYDAIKRFDYMRDAHEYAMERIGVNKQKICEDKFLGMNTVLANQLPQYLDRWKKDIEWRARLKEEQNTANAEVIREVLKEVLQPFDEPKK